MNYPKPFCLTLLTLLAFPWLPHGLAGQAIRIVDFGTEGGLTWAEHTDYNYGFSGREETATTFAATIGGFAQANWELPESVDLSAHASTPLTFLGTLVNDSAQPFRIFIYDTHGAPASVEFTAGFAGGTYIDHTQWNLYAWDAFGGKGTGTIDWSSIHKIGFRTNASGAVALTVDQLVLGQVTIPDPIDDGGGDGDGEQPDPLPEPWTFIAPAPISGPTGLESVRVVQEFTQADHLLNASDWSTPLVSHNGVIFYAYIDVDQDISVIAFHPDGSRASSKVMFDIADNNHHVEPSLGIDSNGFLHLVGNMHNEPMKYYKSARPMDVSEWSFKGGNLQEGGIEGVGVTYPNFFNAPDGTLFIAFRSVVQSGQQGHRAGAIGRYDVATRRWTMLGNPVPKWQTTLVGNTIVWDDSGSGTTFAYQGYKLRCAFSPSGRLHMSWNIAKNPDPNGEYDISANHTHVMYAYSDDKGETWHSADGTAVIPPMGTHNMEPVYVSLEESLYNNTAIAFTADDRGIVGQKDNTGDLMRWWIWDGSAWIDFPNKSSLPGILTPCPYGTLNAFSNDGLYRSWDNGQTWRLYKIPAPTSAFETYPDIQFFRKTGKLRYVANAGDAKVFTIEFSATPVPMGGPLSFSQFAPAPAAIGRYYSHQLQVGGGDGAYAFSLSAGELPKGMFLQPTGLLYGIPSATGSFPVTFKVTDGAGNAVEFASLVEVQHIRKLPIRNISASHAIDLNFAEFAADGQSATRWASDIMGSSLTIDLGTPQAITAISTNWAGSISRSYAFSVDVSNDQSVWLPAFSGSTELNPDPQVYPLSTNGPARFVRITGNGSTFDNRTNLNEVAVLQEGKVHETPWPNAIPQPNGWKSTWFGWIEDSAFPLTFSLDHGWVFVETIDAESAWFFNYNDSFGWFFAGSSLYAPPTTASLFHADHGWIYYYFGTQPRWFHHYASGEDFVLAP